MPVDARFDNYKRATRHTLRSRSAFLDREDFAETEPEKMPNRYLSEPSNEAKHPWTLQNLIQRAVLFGLAGVLSVNASAPRPRNLGAWLAVVVKPRVHRHEAGGALNGAKIVFSCRTGVISKLELWLHPESNRSAVQKS